MMTSERMRESLAKKERNKKKKIFLFFCFFLLIKKKISFFYFSLNLKKKKRKKKFKKKWKYLCRAYRDQHPQRTRRCSDASSAHTAAQTKRTIGHISAPITSNRRSCSSARSVLSSPSTNTISSTICAITWAPSRSSAKAATTHASTYPCSAHT